MTGKGVSKERRERSVEELEKGLKGGLSNALLNGSITAAFLLDSTGTVLAANDTFLKRLGKRSGEIIGHRMDGFFSPEAYEKRKKAGYEVFRTGRPVRSITGRTSVWRRRQRADEGQVILSNSVT